VNAAALAKFDGRALLDAPARYPLDQGPRHGVRDPPEIALGERIEARPLHSHIEPDPERHRPGTNEIALETREQLSERTLPASEQGVNVPALGDTRSIERVRRQRVAFQDQHALEVIGERARR
jgi:hypothetical protein